MPLFKDIFTKKEPKRMPPSTSPGPTPMEPPKPPAMDDIPVDKVIYMKQQGMGNNQIIQTLQRYGYSIDAINNAINQASIKEGVQATPFAMQKPEPPHEPTPPMEHAPAPPMMHEEPVSDERIQEVAEAIIEEKWSDLIEKVNIIVEWKDTSEGRLAKIEQQLSDLSNNFDKLHEGVLGRIGEYDKGLTAIGTEIKALEKVFQKILPGFVENVNELSRITGKLKKK